MFHGSNSRRDHDLGRIATNEWELAQYLLIRLPRHVGRAKTHLEKDEKMISRSSPKPEWTAHRIVSKYRHAGRRGLTLLELVVVLGILVAVAAILVPLMPNLLRRAHKSTDATQSSELAKAVQMCQAATYAYPDKFDALCDSSGNLPSYLPGYTASSGTAAPAGAFGGFVTVQPAGTDVAAALNSVGVNNVMYLSSGTTGTGFAPTRFPYDSPATSTPLNSSTHLAFVNTAAIDAAGTSHLLASDRAADPTAQYVVFGVGPMCTLVGQFIQDAPTSTPQNKDMSPDLVYCHFGVIFKVAGQEVTNADGRAKFMCTVALEDDELEATEKDVEGYYQVARNNQ